MTRTIADRIRESADHGCEIIARHEAPAGHDHPGRLVGPASRDQNPHFGALTVQRFGVDETSTAVTQAGVVVVPATVPA